VDQRVERALEWFEKAQLEVDPVIRCLFLIFSLEAILGSRSEYSKAQALALRRAVLGWLASEGFTHPARTLLLYWELRNAAGSWR
jgi:hypothetical protein